MATVLLTNGQQRKTLAAVRSLGKRNINIIVAEETRFNPSGFSKYCKKFLISPNAKTEPVKYYKWLHDTIIKYKIDVLFPMDDDTMEVVMQHREEIVKICGVTLPSVSSYELACDKGNCTSAAQKAGVPCPKTFYPKDFDDAANLIKDEQFPLVIKPRKSAGSRGIRVVKSKEEFFKVYSEINDEYPLPIIQEYMGIGERYSVCLLYDESHELKAQFVQKHIRRYPVNMGPSVVQTGVEYPELLELGKRVLDSISWTGVAEMEFMVDSRDGKLKFIELNPRFWGSLYAAVISGVDFPWLLYQLGAKGSVEGVYKYKTDCICCWLLPGDILHFISNKDRKKMNPPFLAGKKYGVQDDIISSEDPMPVLGFILACFRYLFDKNMWKLVFRR